MQWSTWKCECLRRRRSIAGCHILWFMSLYFENNCFWLVLPLGYLFQSNECELVCCTVLNNNAYYTAIYEKNCSINEILASTVQIFFFFTSPLCPRTQRPCCRLRDWSQWEKMISLLLPWYHPHSFFFFLPQASPSQPTSYSPLFLFLSLSGDPLFLNRAQKTLNLQKKLWFFCESLSNFIHKEDTLKRAHRYTWAIHCVVLCTVLCKGLETSIFLE